MNGPCDSSENNDLLTKISDEFRIGIIVRNPKKNLTTINDVMKDFLDDFEDPAPFDTLSYEKRIQTLKDKNGNTRHFQITPIQLSDQEETRLIQDVTLPIQREERLKKEKHIAESANQAKSEFLAKMCHEIRTPLNAITGVSELLAETELNQDQDQFNLILNRSSNLLLNIVNNIIDFSQIETDNVRLTPVIFNLIDLIETVTSLFSHKLKGKGVALKIDMDQTLPLEVKGDATKLKQILINLIGNAVKFTKEGSITLLVKKDTGPDSPSMTPSPHDHPIPIFFSVTDTGSGIPQEKQAMIFGLFNQAETGISVNETGAGLGLAISRRFVEAMGGALKVKSAPQKGSTFYFSLILKAFRTIDSSGDEFCQKEWGRHFSKDKTEHFTQKYKNKSPEKGALKRILLVEDYGYSRFVIRHFLDDLPVSVDEAENGLDAITAVQSVRYDLILLDIQIPEMSGYEVIQKIRQFEKHKHSPGVFVIALSAHAFTQNRKKMIELGCDDFLSKPVEKKRLLQMVNGFLFHGKKNDLADDKPESRIDPGFYEMAQLFINEVESVITTIPDLIKENNFKKIWKEAHNIKGTAGGYGLQKISQIAGRMETAAKRCDSLHTTTHTKALSDYLSSTAFLAEKSKDQ